MRRRRFNALAAGAATVWPAATPAQEMRKIRRVGVMARPSFQVQALKDGLRELGYQDGINIVLHNPSSAGSLAQLSASAEELVRLGVEVIVAGGSESVQAAHNATSTIPIVMTLVSDPAVLGFVQSLARPGGNITGVSNLSVELAGKWIELLREADPRIERVGALWNPPHPAHREWTAGFERAASASGARLMPLAVETSEEIERAIAAGARAQATGLVVPGSTLHIQNLRLIANAAMQGRMASIAWTAAFVSSGGLMAYGASEVAQFRRAATYVDKILKGAKPADLPIEQPTRFELAINLRSAKALGLDVPTQLLLRADEVIE